MPAEPFAGPMPEIFLIAPPDADAEAFPAQLRALLDRSPAAALLVPRGSHAENSYKALVKAVLPIAQERNVAVLIEGDPGAVRMLKADGLHVSGSTGDVRAAVDALKPDFVVGAVSDGTRHDAMSKGELDVDYVFFGPISGSTDEPTRELARWWAETMEVPGVLSDPQAGLTGGDSAGGDFLAVGEGVWGPQR